MGNIANITKKVKELQTLLITIITSLGIIIGASITFYNTYFDNDEVEIEEVEFKDDTLDEDVYDYEEAVEEEEPTIVEEAWEIENVHIEQPSAQQYNGGQEEVETQPLLNEEVREQVRDRGLQLINERINQ